MWINVPLTTSPFAVAGRDSTSDWNWLFQTFAQSVGWSGKPSLSTTWSKRWKRVAWLRHLCGQICEPSTAALGAESWIASLRATRANPLVSPASVVDKTILDTFGHTSVESLRKLNQHSYFSKTYRDTSPSGSTPLYPTLKHWIIKLRRVCLQRRKSVQATNESGCSYSRWPTPNVPNGGRTVSEEQMKAGVTPTGRKVQKPLARTAVLWATATCRDWKDGACLNADVPTNKLLGRESVQVSSRLAQTAMNGSESQDTSGLRLNPLFVKWLMGWPEPTGCDFSEMGWSLFKRRMRSCLFGLVSEFE
jgi:hypothetical protein